MFVGRVGRDVLRSHDFQGFDLDGLCFFQSKADDVSQIILFTSSNRRWMWHGIDQIYCISPP